MSVYKLNGIPSDILSSTTEGKRRLKVDTTPIGERRPIFVKKLTDSIGSSDMSVNGVFTPVEFYLQPLPGEVMMVSQWMFSLQDTKGFDVATFASNGTLANGLTLQLNGVDMLGYNIKSNGDIASLVYDMQLHTFGNTDDILVARWSLHDACGQPLRLTENDRLSVIINDDLSVVSSIYVQTYGYYELTQADSFADYRDVNDADFIESTGLDFQVINPNPYL